MPCGSIIIATACQANTLPTSPTSTIALPPSPIPATAQEKRETSGDISQSKLNGIIIGTVLAVIVLVIAVFLWGNRRVVLGDGVLLRGRGSEGSFEFDLEDAPRRPDGGGDGGAPPEAPAGGEPEVVAVMEPAAEPEPVAEPTAPAPEPEAPTAPTAEPAPEAAPPDPAPPPTSLDLALLPPNALNASTNAHHSPSPSGDTSSDDGYEYVYRRRRGRRGILRNRARGVRFADRVQIIPDRRLPDD